LESLLAASASEASSKSSASQTKPKKYIPESSTSPTPEQLRSQAAMIRKNPDLVRKSQPMFANMSDEQIRAYADHIEQAFPPPNPPSTSLIPTYRQHRIPT